MWADPEPNNFIAAGKNTNDSVTATNPRRYKVSLSVNALEIQAWMTRVHLEKPIGHASLFAHFGWQRGEQLPERGVGIRLQRLPGSSGVARPAR